MTLEIKASEENIAWPTTHGFRIPKPSIVPLAYIISVAINSGHQDTPDLCHLHQWSSRMSLFLVVLTLSFIVWHSCLQKAPRGVKLCAREVLHLLLLTFQDGPKNEYFRSIGTGGKKKKTKKKPDKNSTNQLHASASKAPSTPLRGHHGGQASQQHLNIL